jgi:acetyltransferase-like isoleucine patch superfamily enzyme
MLSRIATKLNTLWLRETYPFASFGKAVSIHYSCDVLRPATKYIQIGDDVGIGRDVWLNVTTYPGNTNPCIVLKSGCKIGRRSTISARNSICLEDDVLLAPSVLIMDHNHEYSNPDKPIHTQGTSQGGRIIIGRNCWLGHGAVVFCGKGELVLGQNTVVGANAVVTRSFPPRSVVAGNPARLVRRYDEALKEWIRVNDASDCEITPAVDGN